MQKYRLSDEPPSRLHEENHLLHEQQFRLDQGMLEVHHLSKVPSHRHQFNPLQKIRKEPVLQCVREMPIISEQLGMIANIYIFKEIISYFKIYLIA